MKLYTVREIIEDIKNFEKANMAGLPEGFTNFQFTKLYSEFYDKPLGQTRKANELAKRVNNFINNNSHAIPPCDVWPTDEHPFYIYKVNVKIGGCLSDFSHTLVGVTDTKEKVFELIGKERIKEQTNKQTPSV